MTAMDQKIRARRNFGRIMAALREARRTRDELAGRALSAGAKHSPGNSFNRTDEGGTSNL